MTQSQTHAKTHEPITFYSKTGCEYCNAVRHLLNEHGLAYEERNVLDDTARAAELMQQTQQGEVPTIKIGAQWLVNTDARAVARRLGVPEPTKVKMAA